MPRDILIEIKEVSKSFSWGGNNLLALKNINCKIKRQGMVALMGPSGSGKSTLLNLMGALDTPSIGKIIVNEKDLSELNADGKADFRNAHVGFIFQNFNLIPVLTTLENVVLPAQLSTKQHSSAEIYKRGMELLTKVGLEKQAKQSVNRLSGGQMQRAAVARALINKPQLILADEPTANLDHGNAETILQLVRSLCTNENTTVVIATHDDAVLGFCDRIITLRDGEIQRDEDKTSR